MITVTIYFIRSIAQRKTYLDNSRSLNTLLLYKLDEEVLDRNG